MFTFTDIKFDKEALPKSEQCLLILHVKFWD